MKKQKIKEILELLDEKYPQVDKCFLDYTKPYELLFATILSARCTDKRVNIVTKDLFKKYPNIEDYANADISEFEQDIRSIGFYHAKAKNIILCANRLITVYEKILPSEMEDLLSLNGVGRKTANVIRGHIYNIPSIVVDTHVKRISKKLGIAKEESPEKIEYELMKALPKESWIKYNQQIITHGRSICTAKKPMCNECFLFYLCEFGK